MQEKCAECLTGNVPMNPTVKKLGLCWTCYNKETVRDRRRRLLDASPKLVAKAPAKPKTTPKPKTTSPAEAIPDPDPDLVPSAAPHRMRMLTDLLKTISKESARGAVENALKEIFGS